MRFKSVVVSAALLLSPTLAWAQAAQPASATVSAAAGRYTTEDTEIGALMDDPAARAVIEKDAPDVAKSEQIDMARGMTLRAIQQYAPDILTDAVLAKIDDDLAKLPAKK